MNSTAKAAQPLRIVSKPTSKSANDEISSLRSEELVIALGGPIGSGAGLAREEIEQSLKVRGYKVVNVKVSAMMLDAARQALIPTPVSEPGSAEFTRIWNLQSLGNAIRDRLGDDAGGQLAIKFIGLDRASDHADIDVAEIVPKRVAYIIDQLKHPSEAVLLRNVYGGLFFLVGLLCGYERRTKNLSEKMTAQEAVRLIERDKSESDKNGQQLEKTLKLADFFLRNTHQNTELLKGAIHRFIGLVHGDSGLSPTRNEYGMAAAYRASLKSACLSRQVGAAILDRHGSLISTGCNDVPRAGGGLYEPSSSEDHRCIFMEGGLCFNDKRKDQLRDDVVRALTSSGVTPELAQTYADAIRANTGLKDLIEFSRAVHAEMDAIVRIARNGGQSTRGAFLFTTTYPCHNCARHIVASGIRAVYFIEPYEKSLASALHGDSIEHDPPHEPKWDSDSEIEKVSFVHFEGVAPNRFDALFSARDSRKDKQGKAVKPERDAAHAKKDSVFIDDYIDLESRIIKRLEERLS